MSKIYEALKKAERERGRLTSVRPPAPLAEAPEQATIEDEYQRLRTNLVTALGPAAMRTILVTAPRHHEGTTTVALGLAMALAKDRDARVLLVEANFRTPSLERTVSISSNGGLADYLENRLAGEGSVCRVDAMNLSILPAGRLSTPAGPIDFELVGDALARFKPQYDFVVVDGPPVNQYADASVLGTKVDGVILVVEADSTPVADAEAAKRQLERVGARIVGVVLNRKRSYIPAFLESLL